jgi:hypothetical protein
MITNLTFHEPRDRKNTRISRAKAPMLRRALAACLLLASAGACESPQAGDAAQEPALGSSAAALSELAAPHASDRSDVMKYLARLPAEQGGERALAAMFATGTADHVPVGQAKGYPVLFNSAPELNWLASQLWGGKTFRVVSHDSAGQPVVRLDNMILRTEAGGLLDLFDAYVTLGKVGDAIIGDNDRREHVLPPKGLLKTVDVSFLSEPALIDERPSVILNYFEDESLPIIRRVLDEIREIDSTACPGFYLGRAHVRRCVSLGCGEFPTAIVDRIEQPVLSTRHDWKFWTYFLLNFGANSQTCDLGTALERAAQTVSESGQTAELPAPPVVQ